CQEILLSHRFERDARLSLDTVLGPPRPASSDFLGFSWGGSPKDFASACAKNLLTPVDPSTVPAATAALMRSGELAKCDGSVKSNYGKVVRVGGQFSSGSLEALVVDFREPGDAVENAIDKVFDGPLKMPNGTRVVRAAAK